MAYSPDGELLTYAGDDGKVTTVATATWEPVQSILAGRSVPPRLLARQGGRSRRPARHSGFRVAVRGGGARAHPARLDPDTLRLVVVAHSRGAGQVFAVAYSPSGEFLTYAGADKKVTTVATATWKTVHTIAAEDTVPPQASRAHGAVPEGQAGGRVPRFVFVVRG